MGVLLHSCFILKGAPLQLCFCVEPVFVGGAPHAPFLRLLLDEGVGPAPLAIGQLLALGRQVLSQAALQAAPLAVGRCFALALEVGSEGTVSVVGGRAVDEVVVGGSVGGFVVLGRAAGPGPVRQAVCLQEELANSLTGTRIFCWKFQSP